MPLISCLMPTADRRRYVPDAIRHFQEQDYPERELLILDDGKDPIEDLVPADSRIRYRRLERKLVIGAKRNLAAREARGEILVHWDDDDWIAPWRLSYQGEALERSGADACGVDRVWYIAADGDGAWQYVYPRGQRPWLCGGTLMYRRQFWEGNPFPEISQGEDTRFVWAAPKARFRILENPDFYVARIHARNTSPKATRSSCWHPVLRSRVESLMRPPTHPTAAAPEAPHPLPACRERDRNREGPPSAAEPEEGSLHPPEAAPSITVSIPYFRARPYIRRAVESILNQTHAALRLVVINDADPEGPWAELADIDDPRLIRFDLPRNRGRYFADAVVLAATPDAWLATQDADDWSEPDRLERLLHCATRSAADCAVSSIIHEPAPGGIRRTGSVDSVLQALGRPMDASFRHRLWHHALFRTATLRSLGGYYGGFRVGYDTLLMNLLLLGARVAGEERVLYHRQLRPDSLVHDQATGLRSLIRMAASRSMARIHGAAHAIARPPGDPPDPGTLRQQLRALVDRGIPPAERAELAVQGARLARLLEITARPRACRPALPAPPARPGKAGLPPAPRSRLGLPAPPDDAGWAITPELAQALEERCRSRPPRRVLELGSGKSTLLLARCARDLGFELVTLEHDPRFLSRTAAALARAGLGRHCQLTLAPLKPRPIPGNPWSHWYSAPLRGTFDFVFADGPPARIGRAGALFALSSHLAPPWELWLDDGERQHERDCVQLWRSHFDCVATLVPAGARSFWQIHSRATRNDPGAPPPAPPSPDGLLLTLLTGQRPHLLRQTLTALRAALGNRLDRLPGIVLVNGGDPPTHAVLEESGIAWERLEHRGALLPIGPATSRLHQRALSLSHTRFILHLEDDWEAHGGGPDWLDQAAHLLDAEPALGQVRLRCHSERTLSRHMITGRPIQWRPHGTWWAAASAHFTFNPSLVRAADAARIYPADDETAAQRHFLHLGLGTAQLAPGVFRHLGGQCSLRVRTQLAAR
ncbi:MAG: glycosyltransferase [Verrucomicrobiota bacterium]